MGRPTYDDLREENDPGVLERERLERMAPTMHAAITLATNRLRYLADSVPYDELPHELHALARQLEDSI